MNLAKQESSLATQSGGGVPMLRLLQEVPGIADVAWALMARAGAAHDPVRMVFASAERGSGNSLLAAAAAVALLRYARVPVCLVEANFEHPALAGYLGLHNLGLSDLLDGRASLDECLQSPRNCPGLFVLPGGTQRKFVSGEFGSKRMLSILEELQARGRFLVIDAPCVLDHLDSRILVQQADLSLLVLRADTTRMEDASRAHRILIESGTPLLGSIFNAYGPLNGFSAPDPYLLTQDEALLADRILVPAPKPAPAAARDEDGAANEPVAAGENAQAHANGWTEVANGATALAAGETSDDVHRREVDVLARRIVKLTGLLEQTELELRRIAAAKNIDLGVASIYRGVQGLATEADALEFKKGLMEKIFQANFELQHATQASS